MNGLSLGAAAFYYVSGQWACQEGVEFTKFFGDPSVVRGRDRSELGVCSDDQTPQTMRALRRQELPPSPSRSLHKDPEKLIAHSKPS